MLIECALFEGLEARHIVRRWLKPPEPCNKLHIRPEGPTQKPACRPFRPLFVDDTDPVVHTTGIGCIGPPGLICATGMLPPKKKHNKNAIWTIEGTVFCFPQHKESPDGDYQFTFQKPKKQVQKFA
jgi:hypothetical protein